MSRQVEFSNSELDEAVAEYRKMTAEQFRHRYDTDLKFKLRIEAAYGRDPSFITVDAAGWSLNQFNVAIPPAPPSVHDPYGPGADKQKMRKYERHPGDPPPTY
jgi:hypothetical protein